MGAGSRLFLLAATASIVVRGLAAPPDPNWISGKGHFIFSITAGPNDTSVNRHLHQLRSAYDANPAYYASLGIPRPVPTYDGATSWVKTIEDPQHPGQMITVNDCYGTTDIIKFALAEKAKWIAVKCADSAAKVNAGHPTPDSLLDQFDSELVRIASEQKIHLFGWQLIHGDWDSNVTLANDFAAAKRCLDSGCDGLIVVPQGDFRSSNPSGYAAMPFFAKITDHDAANHVLTDFILKVATYAKSKGKLFCYSPESGGGIWDPTDPIPANCAGGCWADATNFQFIKKADVVMPRIFWGTTSDSDDFAGYFTDHIGPLWGRGKFRHPVLRDKRLVPIIQCEIDTADELSRQQYAAAFLQTKFGTAKQFNVFGIGTWILDEFTIPDDHFQYLQIPPDWPDSQVILKPVPTP